MVVNRQTHQQMLRRVSRPLDVGTRLMCLLRRSPLMEASFLRSFSGFLVTEGYPAASSSTSPSSYQAPSITGATT